MSVRELLNTRQGSFTPSELRIVRELLANYPAAGLGTISRLAQRAGVSDPTVVRLAAKLGFDGFNGLQEVLLAEVEAQSMSPLSMLDARKPKLKGNEFYQAYVASITDVLAASGRETLSADIAAVADLIADRKLRILCLGGRFSRYLAAILHKHLIHLRANTELVGNAPSDLTDRLPDVGPRDVLIVFDYRRYQIDVVHFSEAAERLGARIVLLTDRWKSPIHKYAEIVLQAPVDTLSPFDTMVPALVQTEAVVAAVTARLESSSRIRMRAIERYRAEVGITLDAEPAASGDSGMSGKTRRRTK